MTTRTWLGVELGWHDPDPLEPIEPSSGTIVTWWCETLPEGNLRSFRLPFGWTEQEVKRVAAEMLARQESYLYAGCRPESLRVIEWVEEDI